MFGLFKRLFKKDNAFNRAHEVRESLDWQLVAPYVNKGDENYVKSKRYKNAKKDIAFYPSIETLVKVCVNKTCNTNEFTISLVDVDGRKCTLWCNSGKEKTYIQIRSITPY